MTTALVAQHGEVVPLSLADKPALIERLLPVQKLSAEVFKEQMAVHGKTLTALGSYWKGRKPLILAKACVLGSLLPATDDAKRDLEIFEVDRPKVLIAGIGVNVAIKHEHDALRVGVRSAKRCCKHASLRNIVAADNGADIQHSTGT